MENQIIWRSPSNIAIVKYWGKFPQQIPMNPSLSFTLDRCYTETELSYRTNGSGAIDFFYEGKLNEAFGNRIKKYIGSLGLGFLDHLDLEIQSRNTFPHSAGIASSASAMSALALCLCSLENILFDLHQNECDFKTRSSFLARMGSGSACRSIYPKASLWGSVPSIPFSSDSYGIDWSGELAPSFQTVNDWIFIVSAEVKSVSSSHGHQLMERHVYRSNRIIQANENLIRLVKSLKEGDWTSFIEICEEEALSLHGLMMSSRPSYLLLQPESIRMIQSIRQFRNDSKIPLAFTIDAGPNIHLLFDPVYESQVIEFIEREWPAYINNDLILKDKMGGGPIKMK
ncbi:MAG: diphosphomevalonate decarboxylase [Saprospiraceae bacterium]|nr:diphosphomevalonate decarboxylase [Saprospiraceae bacterium]